MMSLGKTMKKISMVLLCLALCIGNFNFARTAEAAVDIYAAMLWEEYNDGNGTVMPYRLYIPADYSANKSYPVIVFLHGAGERGNDNVNHLWNMLWQLFQSHPEVEQAIVIAPQCPSDKRWVETDWGLGNYNSDAIPEEQLGTVMKILEEVQSEYSTDNDRIYAMGLSMGGFGTWNLLMNHSDVFAAGVPVCGAADVNKAYILKNIPIWTFHGTADPTVPYAGTAAVVQAIQDAGGTQIKFTTYEGAGHGVWDWAAAETDLIDWLFSQKLSERNIVEEPAPGITEAAYDTKKNQLTVSMDTTTSLASGQTEQFYMAVYDADGKLITIWASGEIGATTRRVRKRWDGESTPASVKVFLWSTANAMRPVSYVATSQVTVK